MNMNWFFDPSWETVIALILGAIIVGQLYYERWGLLALTCASYLAGFGFRRAIEWWTQKSPPR